MSTYSPVYTPSFYDSTNTSTKFNPTMAIIIIVLIAAFFLIGFMSIFLKRCLVGDVVTETGPRRSYNSKVHGLAKDTINALPIVHFKDLNEKEDRECPVCLTDFEPEDSLRQLPQCKHVFHLECIDLWFKSHSTCPLCRASLSPSSRQPDNIDYTSDSGNEDVQPVAADGIFLVVTDTIQPENNVSVISEGGNLPTAEGAPITREDERSSARLAMIRNSSSFRRAVRGVAALERMVMSPTTDAKQVDKPVSMNKKSAPTLTGIRRSSSLGTGLKSLQSNFIVGVDAEPQYSNGTIALQGQFLRSESMDSASSSKESTFPAVNPHDHWVTIDLRANEACTAEPGARADNSAEASVSERAWSGRWSLSTFSNLRGVMFPLRRSTSDLVLPDTRPPG